MGTVFEELIRRFNEEAGEHFTPRDAVELMAKLVFLSIADEIDDGTYLLYDDTCGIGGMLTGGEEVLSQLAEERGKQVSTHLFGQEINAETLRDLQGRLAADELCPQAGPIVARTGRGLGVSGIHVVELFVESERSDEE